VVWFIGASIGSRSTLWALLESTAALVKGAPTNNQLIP